MGTVDIGAEAVEGLLEHHGVKGMKWGVRRYTSRVQEALAPKKVEVVPRRIGKARIKTTGGTHLGPSQDAIDAAIALQKYKKSGTAALTNKELQTLQTRMNLEANVGRLNPSDKQKAIAGYKATTKFLASPEGQATVKLVRQTPQAKKAEAALTKMVLNLVKKRVAVAA